MSIYHDNQQKWKKENEITWLHNSKYLSWHSKIQKNQNQTSYPKSHNYITKTIGTNLAQKKTIGTNKTGSPFQWYFPYIKAKIKGTIVIQLSFWRTPFVLTCHGVGRTHWNLLFCPLRFQFFYFSPNQNQNQNQNQKQKENKNVWQTHSCHL